MRQFGHTRHDIPQCQCGRSGWRIHQYRSKQTLPQQKQRRHAVSASVDDPLMVSLNFIVGGRIIQRRIQDRRVDTDVAQQAPRDRWIVRFAACHMQFMSDRGVPAVQQ